MQGIFFLSSIQITILNSSITIYSLLKNVSLMSSSRKGIWFSFQLNCINIFRGKLLVFFSITQLSAQGTLCEFNFSMVSPLEFQSNKVFSCVSSQQFQLFPYRSVQWIRVSNVKGSLKVFESCANKIEIMLVHSQNGYCYWDWRSHSELTATGFPYSNKNNV